MAAALLTLSAAVEAQTPKAAPKADAGGLSAAMLQNEQLLKTALQNCPRPLSQPISTLDGKEIAAPRLIRTPKDLGDAYPLTARQQGRQGVLQVRILLDALGNARFAHLVYSFPTQPKQDLQDAAIEVVHELTFAPARSGDQAVAMWLDSPVRFILQDTGGPMGSLLDQSRWDRLLTKASTGDHSAIEVAAYVAGFVPGESGLTEQAATNLTVQSAVFGDEFARWVLIRRLSACAQSSVVGPWVFAEASAGSPRAQMWFAALLLDAGGHTGKIRDLLGQLARAPDPFWRLWAAGILATSPVADIRDPVLALKVASALYAKPGTAYRGDPDYAEALAAAQAANGQFAAAVATEHEAIARAQHYRWNTELLEQRLASYQSNRAWTGYLCDCQKLAPGQW